MMYRNFMVYRVLNLQPSYVPWLGVETTTSLVYRLLLQTTEPLGQGLIPYFEVVEKWNIDNEGLFQAQF